MSQRSSRRPVVNIAVAHLILGFLNARDYLLRIYDEV
jgi:hypothetical protein